MGNSRPHPVSLETLSAIASRWACDGRGALKEPACRSRRHCVGCSLNSPKSLEAAVRHSGEGDPQGHPPGPALRDRAVWKQVCGKGRLKDCWPGRLSRGRGPGGPEAGGTHATWLTVEGPRGRRLASLFHVPTSWPVGRVGGATEHGTTRSWEAQVSMCAPAWMRTCGHAKKKLN